MTEKRFTGHDVYDGVKERFQFYDNHKRISNEDVLNLLNNFAKKESYHRKNRKELINENNKYREELSKLMEQNEKLEKHLRMYYSDEEWELKKALGDL